MDIVNPEAIPQKRRGIVNNPLIEIKQNYENYLINSKEDQKRGKRE